MKALLVSSFVGLTFAVAPLGALQLQSVTMHAGWVNLDSIVSGEKSLPLTEPTVEFEPAFDRKTQSYTVRMPYGVDGVTLIIGVPHMGEFGVVDFNGTAGQFKTLTFQRGRFDLSRNNMVTFRLQPGENKLRLGYRKFAGTPAHVYEFLITRPESPSDDTTLAALAIGSGALSPAFDPDTRRYRTKIVGNALAVTPTPGPNTGSVTVSGTAADSTALQVDGNVVSGLTAGENTIAVAVQAEDGTSENYTLVVEATLSNDTTLAALEIGSGELSPAFDADTRRYRTRIVGNVLTVTPTPRPNTGSVTVNGTAAAGTALQVDGNSVSRLTAGENTIAIAVRAQDGTSERYILIVEVSGDIRAVAKGDKIRRQGKCDSDIGCDGTLNGIEGRFACGGVDWRSESSNMRINVSGLCLLSTSGGVVTNVAGWHFAAFPPDRR
ncbi:MAG: cadherin-like beta sandwich domain-containing protein [Acidobacteriota bacterium]|nr:cadherin-like beta sandwich domain-containing protein [Acidobacteriota bacterium]